MNKWEQISSSDSKMLEREAFTRGNMFSGNTMLNNGNFNLNYNLNSNNVNLSPNYEGYLNGKQDIIVKQYRQYCKSHNLIYISND